MRSQRHRRMERERDRLRRARGEGDRATRGHRDRGIVHQERGGHGGAGFRVFQGEGDWRRIRDRRESTGRWSEAEHGTARSLTERHRMLLDGSGDGPQIRERVAVRVRSDGRSPAHRERRDCERHLGTGGEDPLDGLTVNGAVRPWRTRPSKGWRRSPCSRASSCAPCPWRRSPRCRSRASSCRAQTMKAPSTRAGQGHLGGALTAHRAAHLQGGDAVRRAWRQRREARHCTGEHALRTYHCGRLSRPVEHKPAARRNDGEHRRRVARIRNDDGDVGGLRSDERRPEMPQVRAIPRASPLCGHRHGDDCEGCARPSPLTTSIVSRTSPARALASMA